MGLYCTLAESLKRLKILFHVLAVDEGVVSVDAVRHFATAILCEHFTERQKRDRIIPTDASRVIEGRETNASQHGAVHNLLAPDGIVQCRCCF